MGSHQELNNAFSRKSFDDLRGEDTLLMQRSVGGGIRGIPLSAVSQYVSARASGTTTTVVESTSLPGSLALWSNIEGKPSGSDQWAAETGFDGRYFRLSQNLADGNTDAMLTNLSLFSGLKTLNLNGLDINGAEFVNSQRDVSGRSGIFTSDFRAETLRTNSGIFRSPVDYRFETATTGSLRNISVAQATGVDHAVTGGRELAGGTGVAAIGDLTSNRTISTVPATIAQAGHVSTTTQTFGGIKTFHNQTFFSEDINLSKAQRWDNENSFLTTNTYLGGFAGSGLRIGRDSLGHWTGTFDNLFARRRFTVYELLLQQLRAGRGNEIFRSGMKASRVEEKPAYTSVGEIEDQVGLADFKVGVSHEIYQEEDLFVPFIEGDLLRQQTFDGRQIKLMEAIVVDVENGEVVVTDNTIPRFAAINLQSGSDDPSDGDEFIAYGSETDPDRQGFVGIFGEDEGAPYMRIMNGIDSREKFGSFETLVGQYGRLDNIIDPDFPLLDGSQQNLYGSYTKLGFFKGQVFITGGNAATKGYVDDAVDGAIGSAGNVVQRSASAPTSRPDSTSLQIGDIWIVTGDGDRVRTWNGSNWLAAMTIINGGNVSTGTVAAAYLDVDGIFAMNLVLKDGGDIRSANYSSGSTGFRVRDNGNVEFNEGTFRGNLAAAGGTFSGDLAAAGGTFSGDLSAVGGTFTGELVAPSGEIGGFSISGSSLIGGSGGNTVGLSSTGSHRIWAGASTASAAPFRVMEDGNIFHPSLGEALFARSSLADFGIGSNAPPINASEWGEQTSASGLSGGNNDRRTKMRVRYLHKQGINKIVVQGRGRATESIFGGTWNRYSRIHATIGVNTDFALISTFSHTNFTLELGVSSLTGGNYYVLEIDVEAEVEAVSVNDDDSCTRETYLREDVYITTST